MTMKEIAYEIEELQTQAEKINSMQHAVFDAIYSGNNALETYEWAFVTLGDLSFSLKNELKKLTDKAFDSFRREGGNNAN